MLSDLALSESETESEAGVGGVKRIAFLRILLPVGLPELC